MFIAVRAVAHSTSSSEKCLYYHITTHSAKAWACQPSTVCHVNTTAVTHPKQKPLLISKPSRLMPCHCYVNLVLCYVSRAQPQKPAPAGCF